jgi:hypothetical protein
MAQLYLSQVHKGYALVDESYMEDRINKWALFESLTTKFWFVSINFINHPSNA